MFTLPDDLERNEEDKDVMFYFHHNTAETNNSKLHLNQFCVSIGIHGIKKLIGHNGKETFSEGDIIFYRPGNFIGYENIDGDKPYQSLMIFFNGQFVMETLKAFGYPAAKNDEDLYIKPYYSFRSDDYLIAYLQSAMEQVKNKIVPTVVKKARLIELLVYLQSANQIDMIALLRPSHPQNNLIQLRKTVESKLYQSLSADELAFICNMSLSTFKRAFNKVYGTSPGKWFQTKRLEYARELLLQGKTPSEVFLEFGYSDYSTFSNSFKKHFGSSPNAYLKK
jgi:AraC family transcriptional regulator, exoenzyme S synthesis regulatory protein ExsA